MGASDLIKLWGGTCFGWFPGTSQSKKVENSLCITKIRFRYCKKRCRIKVLWGKLQRCPARIFQHMYMKHGALEGVTKIEGVTSALLQTLNSPPPSLESLTFGDRFNQSLDGVKLPSSLEIVSSGSHFYQSLEGVTLPSSLRSLTLGCE